MVKLKEKSLKEQIAQLEEILEAIQENSASDLENTIQHLEKGNELLKDIKKKMDLLENKLSEIKLDDEES